MTTPPLVWWDGQLVDETAALVPAISQGSLWGRGVFETIAVRQAQPFALTRHLARLHAGAARLGLQPPDEPLLREAVTAVCAACPPGLHRLRITLTGAEKPGLSLDPEPGHLLIRLLPAAPAPPAAALLTTPWRRNEFSSLCGIKATSYAENALALAWAQDRSATEALFLNTGGDLCEGSVSNLFLIHQGTVLTPSLNSGCLPGITRSLILELCPQLGIPCVEKALAPADLCTAGEVFLTNSIQGILAVETCDHRSLPAPGPLTTRLTAALQDLSDRLPDP
mgnify:CR=1 FL=1